MARELQDILSNAEIDDMEFDTYEPTDTYDAATKKYVDDPKDVKIFTPQDPAPAYEEGQLFFDKASDSLAFRGAVSDMTLNIGQEAVIRVINNTGATITNGQACYFSGFDAVSGLPEISLALADTVTTSVTKGVATHDIETGSVGYITNIGMINDLDTSAWEVGDILYLSDTVPGGYVAVTAGDISVVPDIACRVGYVVSKNALGKVFAHVDNFVTLPPVLGIMTAANKSFAPTATYAGVTNYDFSDSVNLPAGSVDPVTGIVTVPYTGYFRVTLNISIDCLATQPTARSLYAKVLNLTDAGEYVMPIPVPRDQQLVAGTFAVPYQANANDQLQIQIAGANFTTIDILQISYDVESIHIR